jgi:uncharacterized membrane protein
MKEMKYSWQSERYMSYNWFKTICFWLGAIFWFVGIFWIVRLFLYVFYKNLPLEYRLDMYATQMVSFGVIFLFSIAIGIIKLII